ncbi:NGG1p interacting factor NIF3 [Marinospirillum sp.]|uniref:NGG1p interacting factor NIF3 n=1 Tax=Marinospirillum sp. TaxID=2183934 RepID=UPI003A84D46E
MCEQYKLVFYVPVEAAEGVKAAVFATGAGRLGQYEQCCFETLGQGQFRPLAGAQPHLGSVGQLEQVAELKVELLCAAEHLGAAIHALQQAHPYEEPAFEVLALVDWRLYLPNASD